jgi:FtsP/CotA-like multicopper oxidase with cupredoxin domain
MGLQRQHSRPNGHCHEGETIRFVVSNALPEPTSIHFHAMHAPNEADGVAGVTQSTLIEPGGTYAYEFRPRHAGVFGYHSHTSDAAQELKGLIGLLVILPATAPETDWVDRHYLMVLQAFHVEEAGAPTSTDPRDGEFNTFTINGKTRDAATTLAAQVGERVRVSVYNASPTASSLHYHGSDLIVAGQNGHPRDPGAQAVVTTFELGRGNFGDLELLPDEPGLWLFHCQVPRHTANQMQSGSEGSPWGMSRIFDVSE